MLGIFIVYLALSLVSSFALTKLKLDHDVWLDYSPIDWYSNWVLRDQAPHILKTLGGNGSDFSHGPMGSESRILGMVLAFDLGHKGALHIVLDQYLALCEKGYNTNVVLYTSTKDTWEESYYKYLQERYVCKRLQATMGLQVDKYSINMNIKVAEKHRILLKQEIDNYDVFVYQEDDMIIMAPQFEHYLQETKILRGLLSPEVVDQYSLGFVRYRLPNKLTVPNEADDNPLFSIKHTNNLDEAFLEEEPRVEPICIGRNGKITHKNKVEEGETSTPYVLHDGNVHQAVWILTQPQLKALDVSCNFTMHRMLNIGDQFKREYMSSFSLYYTFHYRGKTKNTPLCHVNKLLPSRQLHKFSILHYYHQRNILYTRPSILEKKVEAIVNKSLSLPCWNSR